MRRILAAALALLIAIAGIEPVALQAAEKKINQEYCGQPELFEEVSEKLLSADLNEKNSRNVTDGTFEIIDEDDENMRHMKRASTLASGTCGTNANWTLYSDYELYISGSGAMTDYSAYTEQPWYDYANDIKSIYIDSGITRVGDYAFAGFIYTEEVTYAHSVEEFGAFSFWATFPTLNGTFPISAYVTTIEPYAFAWNLNLQEFVVKDGNEYFTAYDGNLLDINKQYLVQAGTLSDSSISLPSSVKYIYYGAMSFGSYTAFSNSSVELIYPDALYKCEDLSTLTVNSLRQIGASACMDCVSLTSFTAPASVTDIFDGCFSGCTGLSTITFKGDAPEFGDDIFTDVTATAYYDSSNSGWTSSVRKNYGGTITWKDTYQKQSNTITASDKTKTVSASSQTFSLGASAKGGATLSYSSDNNSITVDSSGQCTIARNYIGKATITIKAAATSDYAETKKTITVTVNPAKAEIVSLKQSGTKLLVKVNEDVGGVLYDLAYATNSSFDNATYSYDLSYNSSGYELKNVTIGKTYYFKVRGTKLVNGTYYNGSWSDVKKITVGKLSQTITAKNISKTVSSSERKIAIGATTSGDGKITYKSNNSKIKVKSGKVIIPKNFIGKATITITAASTSKYKEATKKITVTVKPAKATISLLVYTKSNKRITLKIKKNIGSVKYQIQYATNKSFDDAKGAKNLTYDAVGYHIKNPTKGKTYYLRVRGMKTVNGTTYYGAWSDVKEVKIRK